MLSGLIGLSACRTFQLLVADGFAAAEPFGVGGFEIGYVTDEGLEHRVSLSQAWAPPFESCSPPIRRFTSHKRQRHLSGSVVVGHDRQARRLRVVDGVRRPWQ